MGKTLTLRRSTSLELLSSAESLPSCIGTVINDNAEEEDYKDDAPVETSTADVGIEYDLQLQ